MSIATILHHHAVDNLAAELYEVKNRDGVIRYYEVDFVDGGFSYTEARKKSYDETKQEYDNLVNSLEDGWRP